MTTTIYKFEQGRLLVNEVRRVDSSYRLSGVPIRIGGIRTIDKVLSVDTDYERHGLVTPLSEVKTSGSEIFVVMRRGDLGTAVTSGLTSGTIPRGLSGMAALGLMSSITSGLDWLSELTSGATSGVRRISGQITVTANVIGY